MEAVIPRQGNDIGGSRQGAPEFAVVEASGLSAVALGGPHRGALQVCAGSADIFDRLDDGVCFAEDGVEGMRKFSVRFHRTPAHRDLELTGEVHF